MTEFVAYALPQGTEKCPPTIKKFMERLLKENYKHKGELREVYDSLPGWSNYAGLPLQT